MPLLGCVSPICLNLYLGSTQAFILRLLTASCQHKQCNTICLLLLRLIALNKGTDSTRANQDDEE